MTLGESPSIEHWTVRLAKKHDCHVKVEVHMTREQAARLVEAENRRLAGANPGTALDLGQALATALATAMR